MILDIQGKQALTDCAYMFVFFTKLNVFVVVCVCFLAFFFLLYVLAFDELRF
jgi:hypothetical protein